MDRKRNTKARGKQTLRKKTVKKRDNDLNGPTVNLTRWRICPPRILTRLEYRKAYTFNAIGGADTSIVFRINGLYDVDPTLGSTAIPGFTEWGGIYGINRAVRVKITLTFINQEAFPILCGYGAFPFVLAAGAFTSNKYANRLCGEVLLSPTLSGGDRSTITQYVDMNHLFGINTTGSLNQFYGTTLANPQTVGTYALGIFSPSGAVFTTGKGVCFDLKMEFDVEFSFPSTLVS